MEKALVNHSSTLAWKIPWTEQPGRLQPMGSLRVGHDWMASLSLFTFMHWRRKWQPTPVFLPGESQGCGSLVGCRLWGHTESGLKRLSSSSSTPWKKTYDQPRQHIKKQRHHFADKGLYGQSNGFSSRHVQIWELDHKEGWAPKNWCFQTVVLEKTLESPLESKEIKPVNPKGNQPWIFIGRTYAKAEAPILWPPDPKSPFTGKDPDVGKDWGQEKGETGWHGWMASPTHLT